MTLKRSSFLRKPPEQASTSLAVKQKKCKVCRTPFAQFRSLVVWCSPECGAKLAAMRVKKAEAEKVKEERALYRARREKQKTLSDLAAEAQVEVNKYVRLRDCREGCISCPKPATWGGQWHAGHLRSRGASPATRFIVWAIRKQCSECNHMRGGNSAEMYRRMLPIVGQEKLDWLYAQNTPRKWTREGLIRLKRIFRKKAYRLEKRNGLR